MFLEEKYHLHKVHQDDTSSLSKKAAYSYICKTIQNRLRNMQDSWLSKKTEQKPSFADRKDMKKFHDALQTIYGRTVLEPSHCFVHLIYKDAILKRFAKHLNIVFNRPSTINDNAITRQPHIECNILLDEFPSVTVTRKTIKHLYSDKAPGADAIPAEVCSAR